MRSWRLLIPSADRRGVKSCAWPVPRRAALAAARVLARFPNRSRPLRTLLAHSRDRSHRPGQRVHSALHLRRNERPQFGVRRHRRRGPATGLVRATARTADERRGLTSHCGRGIVIRTRRRTSPRPALVHLGRNSGSHAGGRSPAAASVRSSAYLHVGSRAAARKAVSASVGVSAATLGTSVRLPAATTGPSEDEPVTGDAEARASAEVLVVAPVIRTGDESLEHAHSEPVTTATAIDLWMRPMPPTVHLAAGFDQKRNPIATPERRLPSDASLLGLRLPSGANWSSHCERSDETAPVAWPDRRDGVTPA